MIKKVINLVASLLVFCAAAYFLCDITPGVEHGWLSGFWHGIFVIPNYILHFINPEILIYSEQPSSLYPIFFGIGFAMVGLIIGIIKIIGGVIAEIPSQNDQSVG